MFTTNFFLGILLYTAKPLTKIQHAIILHKWNLRANHICCARFPILLAQPKQPRSEVSMCYAKIRYNRKDISIPNIKKLYIPQSIYATGFYINSFNSLLIRKSLNRNLSYRNPWHFLVKSNFKHLAFQVAHS